MELPGASVLKAVVGLCALRAHDTFGTVSLTGESSAAHLQNR
jgi:hypothetical protein